MKTDAEACELMILRGATQTLAGGPTLFVGLHPDLGIDPLAVAAFLRGHGYETFRPDAPRERLEATPYTAEVLARPTRARPLIDVW